MAKQFRYVLFLFLLSLGFGATATGTGEHGSALPVPHPESICQQDARYPDGQALHTPAFSHIAAIARSGGEHGSGDTRDGSFFSAGLCRTVHHPLLPHVAEPVTYGSYQAHAAGLIRRLLYPKHSFW